MKKLILAIALISTCVGFASPHGLGGPLRVKAQILGNQVAAKYQAVYMETQRNVRKAMLNKHYIRAARLRDFAFKARALGFQVKYQIAVPLQYRVPNFVIKNNMARIEKYGTQPSRDAWHLLQAKPQNVWIKFSDANQSRKQLFQVTQAMPSRF